MVIIYHFLQITCQTDGDDNAGPDTSCDTLESSNYLFAGFYPVRINIISCVFNIRRTVGNVLIKYTLSEFVNVFTFSV